MDPSILLYSTCNTTVQCVCFSFVLYICIMMAIDKLHLCLGCHVSNLMVVVAFAIYSCALHPVSKKIIKGM